MLLVLAGAVLLRIVAGVAASQVYTTASSRLSVLGYSVGSVLMLAVLHETDNRCSAL